MQPACALTTHAAGILREAAVAIDGLEERNRACQKLG
jgi:hypothetical protein